MSDEDQEISVDHDTLISNITARNTEDAERAESAGESRQMIKEYLEDSGLHPKAFSFLRTITKQRKQAVALDIIRSIEAAMPMVKDHVLGQEGQRDWVDEQDGPVDFDGTVTPFGAGA